VLDGFAPSERYAVGDEVVARLTESLLKKGALQKMSHQVDVERLDAGHASLPPSPLAARVGRTIASLVYGSLERMEVSAQAGNRDRNRDANPSVGGKQ